MFGPHDAIDPLYPSTVHTPKALTLGPMGEEAEEGEEKEKKGLVRVLQQALCSIEGVLLGLQKVGILEGEAEEKEGEETATKGSRTRRLT